METPLKKESKNKYLLKNTIVFAIGNFATKLITFLLVPLYTNALSTEQFGIVDLLYTVCSFLIPVFSFNIVESVLRFSLDKKKNNNEIMSIALVSILFMIFTSLIMIPILGVFKNFAEYKFLLYLYLITFGSSQIFLVNLKGQEKLKLYSLGNFLYALLVASLNIYLLLIIKIGISGYFLAYIISNILIIIYGMIFGNIKEIIKNFHFDKKLFKDMTKYSIVLIPTTFMWWIMNFLDRIMVTNFVSLSANGIYAVSYKIPTILTVVSSIFTQAWLFSAVKEKDSEDNESYTNKVFEFLAFGTIVIGALLVIIVKPLFKIYVAIDYYEAWKYVPYLMIGYVFLNLSTFISTTYNVHKDSKGYLFSAVSGAIVNCILNIILIPIIGVHGAALATMLSYIAVFLYRLKDTKKYLRINISYKFLYSSTSLIAISLLTYIQNIYVLLIQLLLLISTVYIYKSDWIPILDKVLKKLKKVEE